MSIKYINKKKALYGLKQTPKTWYIDSYFFFDKEISEITYMNIYIFFS